MQEARTQDSPNAAKPISVPSDIKKHAEDIVRRVKAEIRRAESEDFPKWAVWEKQYDGRLELPEIIRQDVNLDIPITREFVRQLIARLINPIFQYDRVCVAKPRRPGMEDDARVAEDLLDYITDQTALYEACIEWVRQAMIYPFGVVKVRFIPPRYETVKRTEVDGNTAVVVEAKVLAEDAKALVEPVPPVHFFVAPHASTVDNAEWIAHRVSMSKHQIKRKIKSGEYANVEKELGSGNTLEVMGMDAMSIAEAASRDDDALENGQDWYKILEVYFTGDDGREYLMLADQDSGAILRLSENPFYEWRRPFVTFTYEEKPGELKGCSAARILEPIHRAYSASVNLRLISAAKANNIAVVVPKGSGAKQLFANGVVKPGVWELDLPIGGKASDVISTFNLSQPFSHLPQLEELLMRHAQKLLSLTDYNFGQEQIQRPTATGQVQLIREGKQALYNLLERFRKKLARVAEIMVARYVQYFPQGLTLYLKTADDETRLRTVAIAQWPKGILERHVAFEPRVSSQSINKEMRKQEKLALADKLPQVYQFMLTLAQQASMPSPLAGIAQKLLTGYQIAVAQWMEEFDVSQLQAVLPDLSQDTNAVANVMAFFQRLQAQMAQATAPGMAPPAAGGVPGPGGGPGLPGSGAPGPVPPGVAPPPAGPEAG